MLCMDDIAISPEGWQSMLVVVVKLNYKNFKEFWYGCIKSVH